MDVDTDRTHAAGPAGQAAGVRRARRSPRVVGTGRLTDAALARQLELDTRKIDEHHADFAAAELDWTDELTRRRQDLADPSTGDLRDRALKAKTLRDGLRKALWRRVKKLQTQSA